MPQSLASILVHLVFSTKHRTPWIDAEIEPHLYGYIGQTLKTLGTPSLAINGVEDHVHILFQLGRKTSIADVVEEIKSSSSRWIKTKGAKYRDFYWQLGYGAFSIGESGVEAVRRYLADQKEHHRKVTFQDEFRKFLAKYQVEYDERYVWD